MRFNKWHGFALSVVGGALLLSSRGSAEPAPTARADFAEPVRIDGGGALVGQGRYYPSPVMHDVDGDGLKDIVVGDLMGRVTFAKRIASERVVKFAKEAPLLKRDGKPLKFSNW